MFEVFFYRIIMIDVTMIPTFLIAVFGMYAMNSKKALRSLQKYKK